MTNISLEEPDASRGNTLSLEETPNGDTPQGSDEYASALEAFPQLLSKLFHLWGKPEFDKLVHDLILDSRGGARKGFPVEAVQELLFLADSNKYVRALDVSKKKQISFKEAFRMVELRDKAHLPADHWSDPSSSPDATHHSNDRSHNLTTERVPVVHYVEETKGLGPFFWITMLILVLIIIKLLFPNLLSY